MKKILIGVLTTVSLGMVGCSSSSEENKAQKETHHTQNLKGVELKVGDQKGNMRAQLEASKLLDGIDYKISWYEFPAAAPVAEALNVNAIDIGYLGDAPFIFANANGGHTRAIAVNRYDPYAVALLVPKNSPIKTIQDFIYRLEESQEWVNQNYESFGKDLARITGIPEEPSTLAFKRKNAKWTAITDDVISTSQETADFYQKHQLLNKKVDVSGLFDREFKTKKTGN